MLSVTMKEGIFKANVKNPFKNPIKLPVINARASDNTLEYCAEESEANIIPDKARFEPTDKSNSPAIMRNVTPMTTIPISAEELKMVAQVGSDKKSCCNIRNIMQVKKNRINDRRFIMVRDNRGMRDQGQAVLHA